jgi:hypothetical protein
MKRVKAGFFGKNAIFFFFLPFIPIFCKKNGHKLAKSLKTQYDGTSELAVTLLVSVETVISLLRFCCKG